MDNPIVPPPAPIPGALPKLWNPNAAACWGAVFSPVFSAYLHMKNAEALGRTDEANANKYSLYGFAILFLAFPFVDTLFKLGDSTSGIGLAILLGWYFSIGKGQATYVTTTLQNRYEKRGWTKPLLTAIGCVVLYMVYIVVVVIITG